MSKYDLRERCYQFSLDLVKLLKILSPSILIAPIFKQLIRSGTSVGANIEEADASPTRKDLKYKMTIAKKEATETIYWLRLIIDAELLKHNDNVLKAKDLLCECDQIMRIIGSIIRKL